MCFSRNLLSCCQLNNNFFKERRREPPTDTNYMQKKPPILKHSLQMDFEQHNTQVRELWKQYQNGSHRRTPMVLGMNPRMYLADPSWNTEDITFDQYMNDPAIMAKVQLNFQNIHRM